MRADPIVAALASLDEIPLLTPEGGKQLAKALSSKSNLIAAKAARIVGEARWTELTADVVTAFARFLSRGRELDKGCTALTALARALYMLDYNEAELFLKGVRHNQLEPVWGGSIDTASELRAVCAMGLASTRYLLKLQVLMELLTDTEWQARAGAARALAATGSESAALLLRFKALSGDPEPDVIADCFSGLIEVEGSAALPFVQAFATSREETIRQTALLALGTSRRPDAVKWLIEAFPRFADVPTRTCLLASLSASRTEAAIDFLLDQIRNGSDAAVSAMGIHRDNRFREQIETALAARRSGHAD